MYLMGTVKSVKNPNVFVKRAIAVCRVHGAKHEAHAKAAVQAFYNDKYLGPWTLYGCECGEAFACDGRPNWTT